MVAIPVQFAHGNGFPSECYQELFDCLGQDFNVRYIPMVGHTDQPVTENWASLVQELIHDIEANWREPVVGMGHSLGGVLMYMASCLRPDLFRQLILLDAPIPGVIRSWMLYLLKRTRLLARLFPVDRAKKRRSMFNTQQEALQYFRHKKLFKQFTPRSLSLYVQYGLIPMAEGLQLRFDRDVEMQIYATAPHNLPALNQAKKVNVPTAIIYSLHSHLIKPLELKVMKRYGFELIPLGKGTHLFPFEYPKDTAVMIKKVIET